MDRRRFYKSLTFKFVAVVALIAIVSIIASAIFYYNFINIEILRNAKQDIRDTSEVIRYSIHNLIKADSYESVKNFVNSISPSTIHSDVFVCGGDNKLIASNTLSNNKNICENLLKEDLNQIDDNMWEYFHKDNSKYIFKTAIDLNENEKIYLLLITDVKSEYKEYKDLINFLTIGSITRVVIATLLSLIFLRHFVLKPLSKLQTAVDNIKNRNFDFHLDISKNDEIGEFATAFNTMAKVLKKSEKEQEIHIKFLNEYKKAIDSSAIVIKSDSFGKITYVNDIFKKITGYTDEEIIGKSINTLRGVNLTSESILEYWDSLLNCVVWKDVVCNKTKDGRDYYVNITVTPILDTNDEIVEYIDIWHDVTEIYKLKEELEHHKENLEHIVEKRTKELEESNKKLQESEKRYKSLYEQAEKTNEALKKVQFALIQQEKMASIGQLAAGVAHELNNPIGFISSNFQTLETYIEKIKNYLNFIQENIDKCVSGKIDEPLQENIVAIKNVRKSLKIDFVLDDINDIFRECEEGFDRIITIVNNLRSFARVDQAEEFTPYNINEGILNTLTVARNEIKYVADVKTELGDVPNIYASGGQINQVLLNIIVNAAQAIASVKKNEKGNIYIRTYQKDNYVVCKIKDDGPGIPENVLIKIFDPFFTTKDPGRGTGLGLHISYDIIVNKHKGRIDVNSKEGEGAEFVIMLPINQKSEGKNG